MKVVAWSTLIVGTIWALLWPSIRDGFSHGLELYLLNDSRIYLHLVPFGLAVVWAVLWGAPFARRWWHVLLLAQYLSVLVVAIVVINPAHVETGVGLTLLLAALTLALVVLLWMGPALMADLVLRRGAVT